MTGGTWNQVTPYDVFLVHYDLVGNVVWERTWGGAGRTDYASNVAVVGNEVHVAGNTRRYTLDDEPDAVTLKYDTSGMLDYGNSVDGWWTAFTSHGYDGFDYAKGVVLDDSGSLYVSGTSEQGFRNTWTYLEKYDSNGTRLWHQHYGEPGVGNDVVSYRTAISGENLYLTARVSPSGPGMQALVLKYTTDGTPVWDCRWGPDRSAATAAAIVGSDVYVTGLTVEEVLLLKLHDEGDSVQFVGSTDFGGSGTDVGHGVVEAKSQIVIAGEIDAGGNTDAILLGYDTDLNLLWELTWGGDQNDAAYDVVYSEGVLYVTGVMDGEAFVNAYAWNETPIADAGADQTVDEGALVALDGSLSSDPDGDALTYEWTQVAGSSVVLSGATTSVPTFTAPSVAPGGETLTFQLVVHDGQVPSEFADTVDVTVKNVNHAPVSDAGDDQSVNEGSPVTLDGAASYDPDGDALTFSWVQTSGPAVAIDGADTAAPTFTAPLVGPDGASLTFELTVDDGAANAVDSVDVRVENVNHDPTADAGPDETRNEEVLVTLDGTASNDPDGNPLTFEWVQTAGPAVALSNPTSAMPSLTAPSVVGIASVTLTFRLTVDDAYGGTASDEVDITVLDTNAPPACDLAQPSVATLWPPNHKLLAVTILGVADREDETVNITITDVTQDEPLDGQGDGDTAPDAVIQGDTVLLRAERNGDGNGRVYRITFEASDGVGGVCAGFVTVCVPHSKGKNAPPCVDDGQFYDSVGP